MRFESREASLPAEGKVFLQTHIPQFADVLCGNEFSASIDSIVVEGHTDRQPWQGSSPEESENKNLKLSQDRSMAVVEEALADLKGHNTRPCFLEKLSATGRGEQDPEKTDDESRRVIFKIHVKAHDEEPVKQEVKK
jgi:flagellar motor protein MotB